MPKTTTETQGEAKGRRPRVKNRTLQERLDEVHRKQLYHNSALSGLAQREQELKDRIEGKTSARSGGAGRKMSEHTVAMMQELSALTLEELESRRLAAQREAFLLNRLRKQRAEAMSEGETIPRD